MTDVTTLLAGIKARAERATEGPWEVDAMDAGHSRYEMNVWIATSNGDVICDMDGLGRSGNEVTVKDDGHADAAFIAAARTDVPRLIQALEAVAKVHEPVDALMNPGRHERVVKVCTGCGTDDGNWQRWPCPTITAITTALGGGEGL